ncbi:MAG: 50S ribosomal protein L24 [Candidatus Bathyarchaeota archaeon]|nr:50S ribosomal protein L24 [Candidatus Bathyarchaeota archaeon]
MRLKKGDQVLIIKGKDRKRKGKILKTFSREKKVLVEGLNLRKRHLRPKKEREKGEIVEIPTPLDISKAKLICPMCKKLTKVGYKKTGERKYRVCKKCKKEFL